jgi:release factor glutamine methyltransferase
MTLDEALRAATNDGLARIDAQVLLGWALGRPRHDRAWLLAHGGDAVGASAQARFHGAVQRRQQGEPVAYITGHKNFHGIELQVDARALDPRPDTETLVDWALECLAGQATPSVLDLGTGSGAIALALQAAYPAAALVASDVSSDALALAQANARRLGLPVGFVHGAWFEAVATRFDLVVSNPPYVREDDPHLAGLRHEPLLALTAGADGLRDLRLIARQAPDHLVPGGWLLLEHGWDQAAAVRDMLTTAGFIAIETRNDLGGIERCTGGQWPSLG